MGRPEPCVLFAQTFVHSQLDEYVDEVIFAEPIVISACEFLEQNGSSFSASVTLLGATSPPSFALEVFVQCEGETRFRRLCQPFLYSHSSSNMLEVEQAVVTSHLVVRGSYRSLTLLIYGNTAEDLGQFSIELDLDSSLNNIFSSTEPKLEDLPVVLKVDKPTIDASISPPNALSLPVVVSDISVETKQLLLLIFKILKLSNIGDEEFKITSNILSVASSCVSCEMQKAAVFQKQLLGLRYKSCSDESEHIISDARQELLDLYKILHHESNDASAKELVDFSFIEFDANQASSKELMEMFCLFINFNKDSSNVEYSQLSQSKSIILSLSVALLLCSGKDGCFYFVSGCGMEQLARVFSVDSPKSGSVTLLLLGVVERATRYCVGCDGFLGWWPREDENIPANNSEGYAHLLKLLLQKQSHVVASLATYILHRLRLYEVISRYECAVLSILGGLSADGGITSVTLDMFYNAKFQLKKLLNLINSSGMVEDPSPVARASRRLMVGLTEGLLSYNESCRLIASSICSFSCSDIDSHFLALLKERGFLPLSAALLASPILFSGRLSTALSADVVSSLESIILSLLFCRSGLIFLLLHPDVSATLIHALRGAADDMIKECGVPPRYASVLISKGLFCDPQDVGIIVETHLRVVSAIDRLLTTAPDSEEFLWVLWELCGLSRFECGRQTLLALVHFPEALSVLMGALHSAKGLDSVTSSTGTPHLNVAIFHSASEIFEVIVADSTASSLSSWVEHAVELHRALHASSPGSNRKDAPARLLEWIDAGVVYHKNGATGLLQYAAMLASGVDAHLTSNSSLVSDSMDIDNFAGESCSGSDTLVVENLGKIVFEKSFDGVTLRDSSVTQLTTALRILAFISENPVVAASLYDEGVMTIVFAVVVNCRFMLERSSNSYDYLVDEGTECNATSDLLLERNREKSLVDLLVPCLVLLLTILQRLQEAHEQHRNTKLMNALLRLHQEVSSRLAACAPYMSSQYPDSAIGLGALCHLMASALACWPIYGWTPGLFDSLLANVHPTSLFVLGPKETCSFLFLLNDLFPEEGILMWKSGKPLFTAFRKLAVGSLLGPRKEKQVNWYLQPQHVEILLAQLMPRLDQIAQLILHCAVSSLVVIHDLLQVFVIRFSCQKPENASVLLRPTISWVRNHLSELSPADTDSYKVSGLLNFLLSLFEHPASKPLLLKEGAIKMLVDVLQRCSDSIVSEGKLIVEPKNLEPKNMETRWALPVFKFMSLICNYRPSAHDQRDNFARLSDDDCSSILNILLRLCQVLPVGRELVECLWVFTDLGSCNEGRNALSTIYSDINSSIPMDLEINRIEKDVDCDIPNEHEWKKQPPLLSCWMKLLTSINSNDISSKHSIDAVHALSSSALRFCIDRKSLLTNTVVAVKFFFGLPNGIDNGSNFPQENIKYIQDMISCISSRITDDNYSVTSDSKTLLVQAADSAKSLLMLLQDPTSSINIESMTLCSDESVYSNMCLKSDEFTTNPCDYSFLEGFGDKFLWECSETLPDRLVNPKRKLPPLEGLNKRSRDSSSSESLFTRNLGPLPPPGPTRRDMFRQRKPNTSRPASMHVDDYVARERNDSNVIAIQRVGSTSGRPPSIHVDEFIARQKERQNPNQVTTTGESSMKNINTLDNKMDLGKVVKPELDDDLQGIDIVFDGEDSESDDRLPFPQTDENLNLAIMGEQNSSYENNMVEDTQSESSASRDKKYLDNAANTVWVSGVSDSSSSQGFSTSGFMNTTSVSQQVPNLYSGHFDRKFLRNSAPPLPPFPPPNAPVLSQPPDLLPIHSSPFVGSAVDNPLPQPAGFNVHSEYVSAFNNNPTAFSPSPHTSDLMHPRSSTSSPILSTRPPPPPPTPPHSIYPSSMGSSAALYPFYPQTNEIPPQSTSDGRLNTSYANKRLTPYPPPHLIPPLPFNRPTLSFPVPQVSQLQPLQPPQLIRPLQPPQQPQPPQHPRPAVQASQQVVQGMSVYYQSQQPPENKGVENSQQDIGMSLHDYFSSPEAIQSLLKDREKLCELLEQHPKLMQMLQEKLGQR